jgi:hypothetical protein
MAFWWNCLTPIVTEVVCVWVVCCVEFITIKRDIIIFKWINLRNSYGREPYRSICPNCNEKLENSDIDWSFPDKSQI